MKNKRPKEKKILCDFHGGDGTANVGDECQYRDRFGSCPNAYIWWCEQERCLHTSMISDYVETKEGIECPKCGNTQYHTDWGHPV